MKKIIQNQKGQVAIFVALIFQVIFVFFAILINVGLLVHPRDEITGVPADVDFCRRVQADGDAVHAVGVENFNVGHVSNVPASRGHVRNVPHVGEFVMQVMV